MRDRDQEKSHSCHFSLGTPGDSPEQVAITQNKWRLPRTSGEMYDLCVCGVNREVIDDLRIMRRHLR